LFPARLQSLSTSLNISICDINVDSEYDIEEDEGYVIEIRFMVKLPSKPISQSFFSEILNVNGVEHAIWEGNLETTCAN